MKSADIHPTRQKTISTLTTQLRAFRRILIWGEPGSGKSTLAIELLRQISLQETCHLLELDPGTPPFGVPGAVSIGSIQNTELHWEHMLPLCTLDSARFRLPLIIAARKLLAISQTRYAGSTLLIDPPGVVKGVGGAEILISLVEALAIEVILILCTPPDPLLKDELRALSVPLIPVAVSSAARKPTQTERRKWRTTLWNDFLRQARIEDFDLQKVNSIGTPPPDDIPDAWQGRQLALMNTAGEPVAMGEAIELAGTILTTNIVKLSSTQAATLLIRNAGQNATGDLITLPPLHSPFQTVQHVPVDMGVACQATTYHSPPVSSHVGTAWATLISGVFGDPLLHIRLRNQKRSFLFDLGASARLQAKIAHQVEAVFLSHAHLDHIGGFIWFLRSRLGSFGPCRIFGPDGTTERIEHFLKAITWDRIDDLGPIFIVAEIREKELIQTQLQPGKKRIFLESKTLEEDTIMADESLKIRAAICDHNIPSIAYALEFFQEISIRKEKLRLLNLPAGPWLGRLKQCIASGSLSADIHLPDGSIRSVEELKKELTIITPGKKLAYVADMDDNDENRSKVVNLAQGAHTLFCEAAFSKGDRDKAKATQHLTSVAAAQIAKSAGVRQLVPFHFSKRYEFKPHLLYQEICAEAGTIKVVGADHLTRYP